jgi:uncharacterized membrane protein
MFDAGNVLGGPALLGEVAYWNIGAAIVGGVLAAAAGVVDVLLLQAGTVAKRTGVLHGLVNFGVLLLFTVILLVRVGSTGRAAGGGLLLVELVALVVAAAGAWYGGELVRRLTSPAFGRPVAGHRM